MLIEERRALAEEFKEYNLYETHLEPMPWKEGMYRIMVPGLRDHLPPVFIGDSVRIRAIRAAGYPLTRQFDGYEHGAFIWAIDRRAVCACQDVSDVGIPGCLHPKFNYDEYEHEKYTIWL